MAEFNLIDEPWIPCVDCDGNRIEYGIRSALFEAHKLREIRDDSPLVTVSLHRLLLAILYRALKGPTDKNQWITLWREYLLSRNTCLKNYLDKWRNRFFLFDGVHPFMQVAGLDLDEYQGNGTIKKDKKDGMMRLAPEAPDKGGRILFDHRVGTERPEYEPSQIARMILAAQSYSSTGVSSGGKIKTGTDDQRINPTACQFAPCVKGLCLWLQGKNLFQTLMANLVPRDISKGDKPAWEDDSIVADAIHSWTGIFTLTGPVQRFAPLSRFIRVLDRKSIFFTNGLKPAPDLDDPMKTYSRKSSKDPYEPLSLREEKGAWRDMHTLFALNAENFKTAACLNFAAQLQQSGIIDETIHFKVNVVGLATDQGKILLWRHEQMPIPTALLSDENLIGRLGGLIEEAEKISRDLRKRTERIAKLYLSPEAESPGGRQPDSKEVKNVADGINPQHAYWSRLEKHFYPLLENLPNDWNNDTSDWKPDNDQKATCRWREQVKMEATQALVESIRSLGTSSRAIQAIARERTNFNDNDLKQPQAKTAGAKKKGGRKK